MSSKVTYRFEDTNTGEIFGEVEVDREADFTITTVEQRELTTSQYGK